MNKEIIGICAGTLTTIAFFPQAYKVYITNKTDDLSLNMYIVFFIGLSLWLIYSTYITSISLMITCIVQLIIVLYIIYKIIK